MTWFAFPKYLFGTAHPEIFIQSRPCWKCMAIANKNSSKWEIEVLLRLVHPEDLYVLFPQLHQSMSLTDGEVIECALPGDDNYLGIGCTLIKYTSIYGLAPLNNIWWKISI